MDDEQLQYFHSNYDIEDCGYETPCWVWRGPYVGGGRYALVRGRYGHHVSYTHFVGSVPEGLQPDHLCRVKQCVNPKHLEAVTPLENIRRANVRTHCKSGHEFIPENTYINTRGQRECRPCRTAAMYRSKARKSSKGGDVK